MPDVGTVESMFRVEVLPFSGRGISYVRNYILRRLAPAAVSQYSYVGSHPGSGRGGNREGGFLSALWYWVLDDDIMRFFVASNGKNEVIFPRKMFEEAHRRIQALHGEVCDMNDVAIVSLEYSQFSYAYGDTDVAINSYNTVACLYRHDLLPRCCGFRFPVREDYDFTLQLIAHKRKTVRFRNLSFAVPGMACFAGGMTEYYRRQKEDICRNNKLFVKFWPSVARECVKGKGATLRDDIRVRWDLLHPRCNEDPSLTLQSKPTQRGRGRRVATSDSGVSSVKAARVVPKRGGKQGPAVATAGALSSSRAQPLCRGVPNRGKVRKAGNMRGRLTHNLIDSATPSGEAGRRPDGEEPSSWKGYVMKKWRCLTSEEAEKLHLELLPPETLECGKVYAVVMPYFDQEPSVVEATLIQKSYRWRRLETALRDDGTKSGDESGKQRKEMVADLEVAPKGFPLMTVNSCYAIPEGGVGALAGAVDFFFSSEVSWEE